MSFSVHATRCHWAEPLRAPSGTASQSKSWLSLCLALLVLPPHYSWCASWLWFGVYLRGFIIRRLCSAEEDSIAWCRPFSSTFPPPKTTNRARLVCPACPLCSPAFPFMFFLPLSPTFLIALLGVSLPLCKLAAPWLPTGRPLITTSSLHASPWRMPLRALPRRLLPSSAWTQCAWGTW